MMRSLPSPDLSEDCAETCSRRVGIQPEGRAEVREGGDGAGGEESFEAIEGALAVWAPVEDRVFPGQLVQRSGDGCKVFNLTPVIPSETQKRANFCGVFGGD